MSDLFSTNMSLDPLSNYYYDNQCTPETKEEALAKKAEALSEFRIGIAEQTYLSQADIKVTVPGNPGGSSGLAGCANAPIECSIDPANFPTWSNAVPKKVTEQQLKDGIEVTWQVRTPVEAKSLVVHFPVDESTGEVRTYTETQPVDGDSALHIFTVTFTLNEINFPLFDGGALADIIFKDSCGENVTKEMAIALYAPAETETGSVEPGECETWGQSPAFTTNSVLLVNPTTNQIHSSNTFEVGDIVRLKIGGVNCSQETDNLEIPLKINGVVVATLTNANLGTDGLFYYDYTIEDGLVHSVFASIKDIKYDKVNPGGINGELWVNNAVNNNIKILTQFGNDGTIVHRPMELSLNFIEFSPPEGLIVEWQVFGPDGLALPAEQQPAPGKKTSFIPRQQGFYSFEAKVKLSEAVEPLTVNGFLTQPIGAFSSMNPAVSGNFYPTADGSTYNYAIGLIKSEWRNWGAEDESPTATCIVEFIQQNETIETFKNLDCKTAVVPIIFTPEQVGKANRIRVTVTSEDDNYVYYQGSIEEQIQVQPMSTSAVKPSVVIATPWDDRVIHTLIKFVVANPEDFSEDVTYNWDIVKIDGTNVPPIPFEQNGIEGKHSFSAPGTYTVKLSVIDGEGQAIDAITVNIVIYPFPAPDVSININSNNTVVVGKKTYLGAMIVRPKNLLLQQDTQASKTWQVVRKTVNPAMPEEIIPLDSNGTVLTSFTPTQPGTYVAYLTIDSTLGNEQYYYVEKSAIFDVYELYQGEPTALISNNLHTSHHVGDTVNNIAAFTDLENATYEWEVTYFENGTKQSVPYSGQVISQFEFLYQGQYEFKLTVTSEDGTASKVVKQSVYVYPADIDVPQASIIAPFVGKAGEYVNFVAAGADEGLNTYNWDFGDAQTGSGAFQTKQYAQTGIYTVKLTVASIIDPSIKGVSTHKITIVPNSVSPPSFQLSIPYAAQKDTWIPMSIDNLNNPDDWNITWYYGDGSPTGSGVTPGSHTYANPGKYQITCIIKSNIDPNYEIEMPFVITIVPEEIAQPSFFLNVPFYWQINSGVSMSIDNLVNPGDWTVTWEFGDSSSSVTGTSVNHSYTDGTGKYYGLATLTNNTNNYTILAPFNIVIGDDPPGN